MTARPARTGAKASAISVSETGRLLIVEDNALIAMMVEGDLAEAGHHIAGVASTSSDALDIVERTKDIDLALVDIDLETPAAGVELAKRLKTERGIPSVFMTGQEAIAHANTDAALGVLTKPFRSHQLTHAVEDLLAFLRHGKRNGTRTAFCWF